MTKKNAFNISLICGLIAAIMLSMVGFSYSCEEMYGNIIRIRILANSDSAEDQALKLAVRDAVLSGSEDMFCETASYDEALVRARSDISVLCDIAQSTVENSGYDYGVSAEIRDEFFDTRVYDDFTLPAGTYQSLVLTIGEGKGQNWWCVIFPRVCVGACSDGLDKTLTDASADIAYNSEKYVYKFKTVEIFEKIKNIFKF